MATKQRLLPILCACLVLAGCAQTFSLPIDEALLNELLTPRLEETRGVDSVYLDLIPNAIYADLDISVMGRKFSVGATLPVVVRDGTLHLFLTDAWVGSRKAPGMVTGALNRSVVPRLNETITRMVEKYMPARWGEIVGVAVTDSYLIVTYVVDLPF